jgi:hypothetical protein
MATLIPSNDRKSIEGHSARNAEPSFALVDLFQPCPFEAACECGVEAVKPFGDFPNLDSKLRHVAMAFADGFSPDPGLSPNIRFASGKVVSPYGGRR